MKIAQSTSALMVVPLSHRSWVLNCCMAQQAAFVMTSSRARQTSSIVLDIDMKKERIHKLFNNVDLSVSSYDTAWVAMVPSPNSSESPCFPQCLNWVMDNQLNNGSWGLLHHHPPLLKDTLSSTLACIVALKRWNVGEDQINKGLQYMESNFDSATDKNQPSPFGFSIIFPWMLEYAKDLNIRLPLSQTNLDVMLHERDLELRRCYSKERENEAYLAYISEGLGNSHEWNIVMKYQMKNGSILNSPSATASALIRHQDVGCLNYLTSLLDKFGNAVPTIYPLDLYLRLCMVDTLERMGIARHFRMEIEKVLEETYKCWVQRDEQISMDVATCALAFRVLRTNGYEVSSDMLAEIIKEGVYMNSIEEPFRDVYTSLEVYRASHVTHQEEYAFREQNLRTIDFLKRTISSASIPSNRHSQIIHKEVDNTLKFPINTSLERISSRRNIEHYNVEDTRILKTIYRSSNISNEDYLMLAVEDFNACQYIYRRESEDLERWVVENRLDKLKFARQKTAYCYFTAASMLSSPELSDARISYAKSCILATVIDDLFDVGGSMDEVVNLIKSIEKWSENVDNDFYSEEVRIIFLSLKEAVNQTGAKAFKMQERNITSHIIEIWLDLVKSMLKEFIWTRDDGVPTLKEYMENGYVSGALGVILLPVLYLIGPKLSEEIVKSSEYHKLFKIMSTQGRILNDIQTFKRELEAGKLNVVTLYMIHEKSTEEEAVKEMKTLIDNQRRKLLKLVLQTKGSIVPKAFKDAFWNTCNVMHLFYARDDGYTGNSILDIVQEIIYDPISISHQLTFGNETKQH